MSHACARANKILLCLLLMACIATPAFAQKKNISSSEKAVLAFYKLSGLEPDFDKWALAALSLGKDHDQISEEIIIQEKLRLQYGLGTYDPPREILKIYTTFMGQIIEKDGKSYLASHFPGKGALEAPYFPYTAGHVWVAVVINGLEKFLLLELDEEHKQKISMLMPEHNRPYELKLELFYRPVSAQKDPIKMDGQEQHIMLGEIAYIGFKKPGLAGQIKDSPLLEYYAPWYMDDEEQDLLKILESRQK